MVKNSILAILSLVTLVALFYGYTQKTTSGELLSACQMEKEELITRAHQQQIEAQAFQRMAEEARNEAEVQRAICESLLKGNTK